MNSPIEGSPLQSVMSRSPVFGFSPTRNIHLSGLASALNSQAPNSKLAPIGRGQTGSSVFQETKMDHKYAGNVSPSGPLISNGGSIETLSGSEFLWGSPNSRSETFQLFCLVNIIQWHSVLLSSCTPVCSIFASSSQRWVCTIWCSSWKAFWILPRVFKGHYVSGIGLNGGS